MVQTRDNDNISKSIKRKDTKQGKLQLATKCPLTKKQQTNNLLTTQVHLHTTQIHRGDRNIRNTSSIKVRQPIRKRSKPLIDKALEHDSSIYYGNHILFFNVFYLILFLNCRLFIYIIFLQIFPATPIKSSKVFFIIFISVFAISNTNNLKSMS